MKLRKSLYITAATFAAIALLVNLAFEDPEFENLKDKAVFEQEANQPEKAEQTLLELISQDIFNIDAHYEYICTHFDIPYEKKERGEETIYRDDQKIVNFYDSLAGSEDPDIADIGHYGSGLAAVFLDDCTSALDYFSMVKNHRMKYLYNSVGNAYMQLDSLDQAEFYFGVEIYNKGNLQGAYSNLIYLLYYRGKTDLLEQMLEDVEAREYFPPGIERMLHFKSARILSYFRVLFRSMASGMNVMGFLAAFLIMASWVVYLRKLDIFEVEKWRHVILTVLLGMMFSVLVYPISDFNNLVLGFDLNGQLMNDFLYCVFGIGALEELVKIIPLFIMLRFSGAINEPFDYIKYTSLSALGFAFVENLIYFDENSLHIIHGRALTAVVAHMFDSSVVAYGLMLNKYKTRRYPVLNFLLFFILASLAHGFYDFWLINEKVSDFSFITIVFLLISLFIWNTLKNNALNQSGFFDASKKIDPGKMEDYLMYTLAGILLFEFIALAFRYGPDAANDGLMVSLYSGTYLIVFISSSLGNVNLQKGIWISWRDVFRRKDAR